MRASEKTRRLTGLALMTAIIVVLQVVASFVKFGPFTITLALAPILIGAALYGPKAGACLGGVFGAVVLLACILGWDPGGAILWNANPFLTALVCLGKGILAGLAAGLVYRAIAWGGKSHMPLASSARWSIPACSCWVCFSCSRPIWRHGPPVLGRRSLLI
ncbi:ECF transporter S component [Flavonifractor plautii]|uniref:ECF transporter S component n=1 Tax=Flavonifractor plautii TaxID=292800 RepID=UPI0034A4B7C8